MPPQSLMGGTTTTTSGTEGTQQKMGRPKSATLKAIQEKVHSYEQEEEEDEDEGIEAGSEGGTSHSSILICMLMLGLRTVFRLYFIL